MGNQWGRGGTGFPYASFNSFGGPQAPFGGTTRAAALPAAAPRGSRGSLAGGDVTSRSGRARRDPGGGRLCKRESTWGCRAAGREHGAPSVRPCKRSRANTRACDRQNHARVRAVSPTAQRALLRRARVHLYKSLHRARREHGRVLLARLQPRVSTHAHARACLQLCKCASVSLPTPKTTDGCTAVATGMGTRGATSSPRRLHPLHCPGGLSTDTLITLTGLQMASPGLRKCWGA